MGSSLVCKGTAVPRAPDGTILIAAGNAIKKTIEGQSYSCEDTTKIPVCYSTNNRSEILDTDDPKCAKDYNLQCMSPDSTDPIEPVNVSTYRRYDNKSFEVPSDAAAGDTHEVQKLYKKKDETDQAFADRCAQKCDHNVVDGKQCRVFKINNNGNTCTYYNVGGGFSEFNPVDETGTYTYRNTGGGGDTECANYIAETEGELYWGFKKGTKVPKSHYKWACNSSDSPPESCLAAPDKCFA